jgi:hypothetical protein
MAILDHENTNNYARLQAISRRVSRQVSLEALYRVAKVAHCGYDIDIPVAIVNAMKAEFAGLRNEIKTLEDNVTG